MTQPVGADGDLAELKQAIASGALSDKLKSQAQAFVDHLNKPLRLSVLGFPRSGKSSLVNLLAGAVLLPESVKLPAVQLSYGDEAAADCTLPDGSIETIEGGDLTRAAALNPVYVEARYPLPALRKLSVLEVAAGPSHEEQKRALIWAGKRSDIALWCTEGPFGDIEQDLWSYLPERVQDHGFIVLTKADLLKQNGSLQQIGQKLKADSQDYFDTVHPLDSPKALSARGPDGAVDRDLMRQSGAIGVISAIKKKVDGRRQAIIDQADLFLVQIDYDPAVNEPASASVEETATAPETPASAGPLPGLQPASREACQTALTQLAAEGDYMVGALAEETLDADTLLDTCADTITWLSEYLSESGAQDDPLMDRTRAAAMDGADLIQLIRLETGDSVSSDALGLLVQLKQEVEVVLAA